MIQSTIPSIIEISVQRDKFLFDYKILIFAIIVMTICLMFKRKRLIKMLFSSMLLATIGYILMRISFVKEYGYVYFLETNSDFADLITVIFITVIIFVVMFVVDKIIRKIKGGK